MPETTQFSGLNNEGQQDDSLQLGTILIRRFKIEGQLGGGGQGAVYQARDLNFPDARRLVAVKEMNVTGKDQEAKKANLHTFKREANILATLNHPAIPKIYDSFEQNERAYLVMEYINGRDLEAILHKTKSLPMDKIIEWSIDLCDVLDYLHSHQPEPIIFRDMKPANIMIDSLGKVRLIDFGIAKIFVQNSNLPQTMIGTEGYSAPEQYRGKASPLSDIYSLGATLHQVVTRNDPRLQPPFSFHERPIREANPEVPEEFARIIGKALEFEPEDRYQTGRAMKEDLQALRLQSVMPANLRAKVAAATAKENNQIGTTSGTSFFDGESASGGIEPVWTFKTEDEIRSSPIVYNNIAFVGSYDTNIWAVKIEDGNLLWKRPSQGGIASSPVIDTDQKQLLYGSEDYTYNAVNYRDGRLNWTYSTGDKIRGTGTVKHGHVFFGSDDGKLYALIANNGRFMWEYDADAPVRSAPLVTNDRIIFGAESGELFSLELSGNRKWAFRTRKAITSTPAIDDDGIIYFGSFDGFVYAVDAENGYSQWRFRTQGPVVASPVVKDMMVYIGSTDGKLYCLNAETGREKWQFETEEPIISSPRIHQDTVYFGGTDNHFYAVDARTGQERWKFEAGGAITSTPFITSELILFGSLDRHLYALPLISS